ncbi:hypothetical protein J2X65_004623 [Ancylobacter sp. 3268]|uniref:hypothetical protein n=1 Tax=Ancylobacter sp. 3268 TaxID=2817752 RepID=UPI00285CAE4E|nr:hypothetical protein [Ancylobacter sp. 3268]MDR6955244.1 hypothetical protein [Ancylobacter sp. 3268]
MTPERPFTIGLACEALGIKVERFKTLRRRDHLPFIDQSPEASEQYQLEPSPAGLIEHNRAIAETADRSGWIRYTVEEIALLSAQIELVDVMKLDVAAASRMLANARGTYEGEHPATAKPFADIWIGAVIFGGDDEGRAHIGGTLEEVSARIAKEAAAMAVEYGSAPSQIVLVNLSKHFRKIRAALAKVV